MIIISNISKIEAVRKDISYPAKDYNRMEEFSGVVYRLKKRYL